MKALFKLVFPMHHRHFSGRGPVALLAVLALCLTACQPQPSAAGADARNRYEGFTARIDTLPLWPEGSLPNSKGLAVRDSVFGPRVFMVSKPWMDHFVPVTPALDSLQKGAPAVLIIPGGGYARLAYELAGDLLAKWFNSLGVHAFVLYHRLPHSPDLVRREIGPLQDAQRALRIIRARADEWGIDPGKVGAMGCSAGGHLTGTVGTHREDVSSRAAAFGRSEEEAFAEDAFGYRPDFLIMVSPVVTLDLDLTHQGTRRNLLGDHPSDELVHAWSTHLTVDETTPPALLIHADNDPAVPSVNSVLFYSAMRAHHRPASLHVFPSGGHAISLEPQPGTTEFWSAIAKGWLEEMEMLP